MACENCVWGRIVFNSKSLLGHKVIIVCSKIDCTQMPEPKEDIGMNRKPLIYVCSPLRGNQGKNLMRAARFCRFVSNRGGVPFAPHLFFSQFLDDDVKIERELGIEMGIDLMHRCTAVWVFGDIITEGMQIEIDLAEKIGVPVVFYDSTCRALG